MVAWHRLSTSRSWRGGDQGVQGTTVAYTPDELPDYFTHAENRLHLVDAQRRARGSSGGWVSGRQTGRGCTVRKLVAVLTAPVMAGTPLQAQTWTAVPATGTETTIAATAWGDGTRIVARCDAGRLVVMVAQSRPLAGPAVRVLAQVGEGKPTIQWWRVSQDGRTLIARRPASFLRSLRGGGAIDLVVKSREASDWEATLALPSDVASLDAVMTACNALDDVTASDDDAQVTWLQRPSVSARDVPSAALRSDVSGIAVVDCLADPSGRPVECVAIDEAPAGMGFGAKVVALVERGRLNVEGMTIDPNDRPTFFVRVPMTLSGKPLPVLSFLERVDAETAAFREAASAP